MIYPLIWMFFSSFKESSKVLTTVSQLFPDKWEFSNYLNGWAGFGGTTFTTFFRNSIIVTVISVIGNVIASAMAAYGFSRLKFKGRNFFFVCMIITMMIPSQVLTVPQYVIFNKLGWVNTFLPLTVPEWGGRAFFIFLIMQFITGIPKELDEAAEIDGANKWQQFLAITIPCIKPVLMVVITLRTIWVFYMFADVYLLTKKVNILGVYLYEMAFARNDLGKAAAISIVLFVIIFAFIIFIRKKVDINDKK